MSWRPPRGQARAAAAGAALSRVAMEQLKKLKVVELKEQLSARGLPVSGKKDELIERLLGAMAADAEPAPDPAAPDACAEAPESARVSPAPCVEGSLAPAPADPQLDPVAPDAAEEAAPLSFEAQKEARAARFGIPLIPKAVSDEAKLKSRAERFGLPHASAGGGALDDNERKKLDTRAERFGLPKPGMPTASEKAKPKRAALSDASEAVDQEEEARRKKRAARFGIAT